MGRNCHHLPEEVVMDILLRLPIKSLTRFKCVCKSWYALITDTSFVDNHLHFNKKIGGSSSKSLFLTYEEDNNYRKSTTLITISNNAHDRDDNDFIPCVVEDLNLSHILGREITHIWKGSHCNGIILLTFQYYRTTIFYNPAIRDFKPLPRRLLPHGFEISTVGFGHDSKANDYKFVRILDSYKAEECIAEVYTLGSDCWKQIKIDIELEVYRLWELGVYCKGVCFWMVPRLQPVRTILSFDMSDDEFRNIPLPDSMQREDDSFCMQVAVWNESIAVFFFPDETTNSFEIWVVENYLSGVEGPSWTKRLTIRPLEWMFRPIIFWKSDELLVSTEDGKLVSYNLGTEQHTDLPFRGMKPGSWHADFYMQSLVRVNRRN